MGRSEEQRHNSAAMARIATSTLLVWTTMFFVWAKRNPHMSPSLDQSTMRDMTRGMLFAVVATCGNSAVSLLRKQFSKASPTILPAHQVGVSTAIQGVAALVYCNTQGVSITKVALTNSFAIPALMSSVLNALTKVLETRAYATTDVSLCAPFLAFDPVMQFVLPVFFAPLACKLFSVGCDEVNKNYPPYHPLAVMTIAAAAFLLALSGTKSKKEEDTDDNQKPKKRSPNLPQESQAIPFGSKLILTNCVIYAVTSRLDKAAIAAADKTVYYTYGRIAIASTCFTSNRPTREVIKSFFKPASLILMLLICLAEAVYMLALFQAFSLTSPIYVTAVKRGGGLLVSSLAGSLFFGEPISGRLFPVVAIVAAVVALCL